MISFYSGQPRLVSFSIEIFPHRLPKSPTLSNTPDPKPDMLKLEGDWQDMVKQSLRKKKPARG